VGLLLSCGGGDLVLPSEGEPAAITIVQGDAQSGRVGNTLAEPVVARVTDSQGRPVAAIPVAFAFTGGVAASVAPDTAMTDADGRAPFQILLGPQVGSGSAEVRVSGSAGSGALAAPVQFTALPANANELVPVSGDSQSARVGGALADPLVVQVTDAFGNPIAGVDVAWTAVDGGSVSQATVQTGDDGLASVEVTLGPNAGIQHTTASAPGLAGSPVTFTATALPGAATTLEVVSGDGQTALVGTPVPDLLVVRARDAGGNPVAGLGVTWLVTAGRGSVAPQNGTTGQDGQASTSWTLGPEPGANTVAAVISGVGTVEFTATGNPGAPPALSIETQPPATAVRGLPLSRAPAVQLREPDGSARAQAGVRVSVKLATAGGTLRGTLTRTTGPSGGAEFGGLVIEGPPGTYALAFSAPGYSGATSAGIALARAPSTIEITSDKPDPSAPGEAVQVAFRVQSAGGAPDGTVQVTADDGSSCSANVGAGACALTLTAVGSRTITATYSGSADFEGATDTESHEVQAAPPPVPSATRSTVAVGNTTLPLGGSTQVIVTVRDAAGGPLQGVAVSVTGSGAANPVTPASVTTDAGGAARFTFDAAVAGTMTLTAVAGGVTLGAQPSVTVQRAETKTSITADAPDPSAPGEVVTVAFSVTSTAGTPTGTVKITASGGDETCSGSLAQGSCALTLTTAGNRTLTATYSGDDNFSPSSGVAPHIVGSPSLSIQRQPSSTAVSGIPFHDQPELQLEDANGHKLGQAGVAITAALAPGAGGSLSGTLTRLTDKDGRAKFDDLAITGPEGSYAIEFSAAGFASVTSSTITLQPAPPSPTTTTITSDLPDPSVAGVPIPVSFTVTSPAGTPAGSVVVTASGGEETCSASVAEGGCTLTLTVAGSRTLTASFSGAGFAGSSDDEDHFVVGLGGSSVASGP
jgi:hypothetical protein